MDTIRTDRHLIALYQYRIMREWYALTPRVQAWLMEDAGMAYPDPESRPPIHSPDDALALKKLVEYVEKSAYYTGKASFADNLESAHSALINAIEQDAVSWLMSTETSAEHNTAMDAPNDINDWNSEGVTTFMDGSDESYLEYMSGTGRDAIRAVTDMYSDTTDSVYREAAHSMLQDEQHVSELRVAQRYRTALFTQPTEYPVSENVGDVVFMLDSTGNIRICRVTDVRDDPDPDVKRVITLTDKWGGDYETAIRDGGEYFRDRVGLLSRDFFSEQVHAAKRMIIVTDEHAGMLLNCVLSIDEISNSVTDSKTIGYFSNSLYADVFADLMMDYNDRVKKGIKIGIYAVDFGQWEDHMNCYMPSALSLSKRTSGNSDSLKSEDQDTSHYTGFRKTLNDAIHITENLIETMGSLQLSSHGALRYSGEWVKQLEHLHSEMQNAQLRMVPRVQDDKENSAVQTTSRHGLKNK